MTALRWNNLLSEPAMGACQKQKSAAIRAPLPEDIGLFPGSSVVEQLTVNQLVVGSNPTGASAVGGKNFQCWDIVDGVILKHKQTKRKK